MARLYKVKWAFLNSELSKDDKIKVLELYEINKIKLFFINPSVFKSEQYLDFHCDLLVAPDLHLYL
jgi:superfamily II DNA helicase RecQ